MPSPLPPYQLSSSQSSSTTSSRAFQHRKSSTEKPGFVHRTSSSSSLHRATSNKSNSSIGLPSKLAPKHHHHHAHVAHTSASKHHRTTSFGHRIPSYGKGLNKLTALTTVSTDDGPREHLSIHSIVDRVGGASMQRSLSEGNALARKERRQSSSSVHSARPKVRRPVSQPQPHASSVKSSKQHVSFTTRHSSEDEEEENTTNLVHRKSTELVASPQLHPDVQRHLPGISPATIIHPLKSGLREGLASSAPRFLQKSLSQVALVPPKVSHTNAVSKDLTRPSTSAEQAYTENPSSTGSEAQVPPSSNPISHFISSTPPSRTPRTPDIEISSGLRRNQSATSLAIDHTIPLTSASQGKLTRTQQKLLLQRASTQPLNLTAPTTYTSSPSLQQVQHMESTSEYFSPLPSTPGQPAVTLAGAAPNIPYDVKVAREFDRISRELVNARRFGDPTADAIARLRERSSTTTTTVSSSTPNQGLTKKGSSFGLSMSWKRSPDKNDGAVAGGRSRARVDVEEDDAFGRDERRSRVRDLMRQMWFDEVDGAGTGDEDERDRREEVGLGRRKVRRASARS